MPTPRPPLRKILMQDEFWWTANGDRVPLDEMAPSHLRNTLVLVEQRTAIRRAVGMSFPFITRLRDLVNTPPCGGARA